MCYELCSLVAVEFPADCARCLWFRSTSAIGGDTEADPNTGDHVQHSGLLYGHGKTMVICSHMLRTNKDIWGESGIPQRLAVLGYQVLAYDFRGNGDSAGLADASTLDVDLRAAVVFAHQQGATKIVLLGASMGGTALSLVGFLETEE